MLGSPLRDATCPPISTCPPCRRNLSCPLFEQERLRYYRSNYEPRQASPPVGVPLATTSALSPMRQLSSHPVIGNIVAGRSRLGGGIGLPRSGPGWELSHPRQLESQEGGDTGPGQERHMGSQEAGPGGHIGSLAPSGEEAGLTSAGHDADGMPGSESRSEGSVSEESGVMEARRRWLLGCASDAHDYEEEEEEEGGGGGSEEVEGSGGGARAAPLFERLPLGMPCKRGSDSQALWLACNDDVLLGRADNGERAPGEGRLGWVGELVTMDAMISAMWRRSGLQILRGQAGWLEACPSHLSGGRSVSFTPLQASCGDC